MKRYFNTSGPNIPADHYTLRRQATLNKGMNMVEHSRYFTIWAPRQTGKSTYFRLLAEELKEKGYKVCHINLENFVDTSAIDVFHYINDSLSADWNKKVDARNVQELFNILRQPSKDKCVWIIDEIEGLNPDLFGQFLHTIRNLYHSREKHCLQSVILVGVTNILGVVQDNASPFNIADNLDMHYFTNEEVHELLEMHTTETGQKLSEAVTAKIAAITAGQPGLVNGFAQKLITEYPDKQTIEYNDYLKIEDWYLTEAIDKNFSNILHKAKEYHSFMERLLFTEDCIPFRIDRPSIMLLHTNGLIKKDSNGNVSFWVPFYKKRLYDAFYPYTNGEKRKISKFIFAEEHFTETGDLKFEKLIETYKEYVKRRGFNPHREKDENGKYKSIKEAALIYSFETYIHAFISQTEGKIYREANTGLGKSDMILNVKNKEYLIETKIYYAPKQFEDGKRQLAYYCQSLKQTKGLYLVYCPNDIPYPKGVKEQTEIIEDVEISTFLIEYDETKWDDD